MILCLAVLSMPLAAPKDYSKFAKLNELVSNWFGLLLYIMRL